MVSAIAAKLEFYHPKTGALKSSLTNDIERIEINESARDQADDAAFFVSNIDGGAAGIFNAADEVRVYVQLQDEASLTHIWTGILDADANRRTGHRYANKPLRAMDWVYRKLATTYVTEVYSDTVAGEIVRDLVGRYLPTVDTANVLDTSTTLDGISFNGASLLDAIREVAERAGAEFHGDKDKALHFFEKATVASGATVSPAEVLRGSFNVETSLAGFGNVIQVRGGSRVVADQDNGESFDSWSVLTGSTRKTQRVFVSKSGVARVDVWTDPTGYTGDLRIRIQAENEAGTGPIDETDDNFDLANRTLTDDDLTVGGYTEFHLPEHVAPPGGHVWIIADCPTDGQSQRVGQDATGSDLVFVSYYSVPIIVARRDQDSINTYGRSELAPIFDKTIASETEATLIADMALARHATPPRQGAYEIKDPTTALASVVVGQTVSATFTADGVAAATALVVTGVTRSYDSREGGRYRVAHTFTDAERVQRVEDILLNLNRKLKRLEDSVFGRGADTLIDTVRDAVETATVADAAATTVTDLDTTKFKVGSAKVGFSVVG